MLPPRTKSCTRYCMRLAPALSTSWTKGSLFSSAISCSRSCLSSPMGCSAPASMPESEALIMQRTPATRPMPAIRPPPGTLLARSGLSWPRPASVASGRKGAPVSSSSARRSRGSNWPRLAKRSAEALEAATARASWDRTWSSSESMLARLAW
ncbi:hypothetical protein D9M68_701070 [compost metagenome]